MMKRYAIQIVAAVVISIFMLVLVVKVKSPESTPETPKKSREVLVEDDYSKEQKELLVEMKQMRADIEKAKTDINLALQSFNASAVQRGLDPNVVTTWLQVGYYGPTQNFTVVSGTTNKLPILWGFRGDGLVTWKNQ